MLALGPAHPHIALLEDNAVAEKTKSDGFHHAAASENATIAERRGASAELQRLVVGDVH
jgi:hypothetical protein